MDGVRDLSDSQMEALADLAETYGLGELHVGDEIVLPHVARADLAPTHDGLLAIVLGNRRLSDTMPFTEGHHAREAEAA
jgi:hypothetical protein